MLSTAIKHLSEAVEAVKKVDWNRNMDVDVREGFNTLLQRVEEAVGIVANGDGGGIDLMMDSPLFNLMVYLSDFSKPVDMECRAAIQQYRLALSEWILSY